MNEDFTAAAARHWNDAGILFSVGRFDNAAYLAGYVVECSLKSLIKSAGLAPKPFSHAVKTLAGDVLLLACIAAPSIRRYCLPTSAQLDHLVKNWNPEMRYWPTGQVAKVLAEDWISAAGEAYRALVIERVLDGWSDLS